LPIYGNDCLYLRRSSRKTARNYGATARSRTLTHEQLLLSSTNITTSFHDEAQKQLHSCHISFPNADQIESSACKYDDHLREHVCCHISPAVNKNQMFYCSSLFLKRCIDIMLCSGQAEVQKMRIHIKLSRSSRFPSLTNVQLN